MRSIPMSSDELVAALVDESRGDVVCILDSSGVSHQGSRYLIAGIMPVNVVEHTSDDPNETLAILDKYTSGNAASFFSISYDLGMKLNGITSRQKEIADTSEPDIFVASCDVLIVHDYEMQSSYLIGNPRRFDEVESRLTAKRREDTTAPSSPVEVTANFTKDEYISAIDDIQERIRSGDTYQTNLTQRLKVEFDDDIPSSDIFERLRHSHPAPFAAFIKRLESAVVSASPERFFRVLYDGTIKTSPIKGTRPRGSTASEDDLLRSELLNSAKDRAENTMIVDLLRNDIGRVCEFGSVHVEELCSLEEHPTLFHLISTIRGDLRKGVPFSEILRAVFPCGSITGAPKISTMKIIDEIESVNRGLSMGAIGYYIPQNWRFGDTAIDLSVAIRTMVIRENIATLNVGGGITIDSEPEAEYEESLVKAKALLAALGGSL